MKAGLETTPVILGEEKLGEILCVCVCVCISLIQIIYPRLHWRVLTNFNGRRDFNIAWCWLHCAVISNHSYAEIHWKGASRAKRNTKCTIWTEKEQQKIWCWAIDCDERNKEQCDKGYGNLTARLPSCSWNLWTRKAQGKVKQGGKVDVNVIQGEGQIPLPAGNMNLATPFTWC